jgi:hypothetical protein
MKHALTVLVLLFAFIDPAGFLAQGPPPGFPPQGRGGGAFGGPKGGATGGFEGAGTGASSGAPFGSFPGSGGKASAGPAQAHPYDVPVELYGIVYIYNPVARETLEAALVEEEFDFLEAIAMPFPINVLLRILGCPREDAPRLVELSDSMIANTDPDLSALVVDQGDTSAYRLLPFRSPAAPELFGYAHALRPFSLEDVRNYVHFHLLRAEVDPKLFTEEAIKRLFQSSHGRPRAINQLATQALIQAVVLGRDSIDGDFMNHLVASHPLYQAHGQP